MRATGAGTRSLTVGRRGRARTAASARRHDPGHAPPAPRATHATFDQLPPAASPTVGEDAPVAALRGLTLEELVAAAWPWRKSTTGDPIDGEFVDVDAIGHEAASCCTLINLGEG